MALPVSVLPTDTLLIAGETVSFRSLSRSEAMKLTQQYLGNPDGAEIFVIAASTGVTEDEAKEWRETTDIETVGTLVDAIIYLSGLAKKDDGETPKA